MIHPRHEKNIKAIISFLIVLIALGILLIFVSNKDTIVANGQFGYFITLAVFGSILLISLLYLVSNSQVKKEVVYKTKVAKKVASKSKKKKSKRR